MSDLKAILHATELEGRAKAFPSRGVLVAMTTAPRLFSGWRHFRVQDREDGISAVEIERKTILRDLYDGSLKGLVLRHQCA